MSIPTRRRITSGRMLQIEDEMNGWISIYDNLRVQELPANMMSQYHNTEKH